MTDVLKTKITQALSGVIDPASGRDIVACGMLAALQVTPEGRVLITLEVDAAQGPALEPLRQRAEQAAAAVPGVTKVTAVLTAQKPPASASATPASAAPDPHGMNKNPRLEIPVRHVIAVASGKGGVGKSMVAVNLAAALAGLGLSTGLLDADIYGPSVPRLCGLEGQKPSQDAQGRIIPLAAHGLKVMSIGFMVDPQKALIWRGPMVQSAIYQMLRDVAWADPGRMLDVLIVDMPPGTGDAQLTLAQKVPLSGAIIVSTPQDIALIDARKAVQMFRETKVPLLGLIENMSTHICTSCGHEEHIFGHGGARAEAAALGVPFLGEIPLRLALREMADRGEVAVRAAPQGPEAKIFTAMAGALRPLISAAA